MAAEGWTDLRLLPFFSMVDRRRSLHRELMASARAEFPAILEGEVPYRSEIERMAVRRAPLAAGGATSEAALIYTRLWQQIVQPAQPAAAPAPVTAAAEASAGLPPAVGEVLQHP